MINSLLYYDIPGATRDQGALNGCVNGYMNTGCASSGAPARAASVNVASNRAARELRAGQAKYGRARRDVTRAMIPPAAR